MTTPSTISESATPSCRRIHIVIPAMDEGDSLRETLTDLNAQSRPADSVSVCINQPDHWWDSEETAKLCERNRLLLEQLQTSSPLPIAIIDRCSKGQGWTGKHQGVGMARRTLMDTVAEKADETDLIVNLDADTRIQPDYLRHLEQAFDRHPDAHALSAPYYHRLTGAHDQDCAILQYEIYMRHYLLNLFRIRSPQAFTAMGSAMVCTAGIYRKLGGITPRQSGEDFYFIQKLVKTGRLLQWCPVPVNPSPRSSTRVPFGTGAAVAQLLEGNPSQRWPLYAASDFDVIAETYHRLPELYRKAPDPASFTGAVMDFIGPDEKWENIRKQVKNETQFIRSAHERLDGLRILQFLRSLKEQQDYTCGSVLRDHLASFRRYHPELESQSDLIKRADELATVVPAAHSLGAIELSALSAIRDLLYDAESLYRQIRDTVLS